MSRIKIYPGFISDANTPSLVTHSREKPPSKLVNTWNNRSGVSAKKTDLAQYNASKGMTENRCPIHKTHNTLNNCRKFKAKRIHERRKYLRDYEICCSSKDHRRKTCKGRTPCVLCGSDTHASALHFDKEPPLSPHGGKAHPSELLNKVLKIYSQTLMGNHVQKLYWYTFTPLTIEIMLSKPIIYCTIRETDH